MNKKRIPILIALLLASSVQYLHGQAGQISPIALCAVGPCPSPTPFPTPTPTPTPVTKGSIAPKFVIVGVTYAPPGSKSNVTYSNSTLFGSSLSLSETFGSSFSLSVTDTQTLKPLDGFSVSGSSGFSVNFSEELDSSNSIAVTQTATRSYLVNGPLDSSLGIDHNADIIWVWLNPVLNFSMPSPTTIQWSSVGFESDDPAKDLDIVGIPVAFLNGSQPIPTNDADPLARRWAPRILCTSADPACGADGTKDPGLTQSDFNQILKADPFTDPAYLIDVPQGTTCTTDGRFCLATTSDFQYAVPPAGQQPTTETFQETRQVAASQGVGVTFKLDAGISDEFTTNSSVFDVNFTNALKTTDTLSLTIKLNQLNNQQATQTSAVSITGPATTDNYQGPTTLNVFQDNVFGTFMFGAIPQPTFTLSVSPASQSVSLSNCTDYSLQVGALVSGFNNTITFGITSVLPAGITASFNPTAVTGAGASTMHICAASSAALTSTAIKVRGVNGIEAHSVTATVSVTDFTASVSPSSQTVVVGGIASYTVTIGALNGFSGAVALSVCGGLPSGVSPTFSPSTVGGSGTSTLGIPTSTTTATGTYTVCIAGTNGARSHSANVTLIVNPVPAGDFTLSAAPASQIVMAGNAATYTLTMTPSNGFTGTIKLSVSGPTGIISADLSPSSVTTSGSATLTLSTDTSTSGAFTFTITGVSGSLSHSATVRLSVRVPSGCTSKSLTAENGQPIICN